MKQYRIRGVFLILFFLISSLAHANTVTLYGPGGPHSALIQVSESFTKTTGIKVDIVYGPQAKWDKEVLKKADIIYSASDNQMVAFVERYKEKFSQKNTQALYLHKAIIITQKGNPKKIQGIRSLLKPSINIVVNDGAGISQTSGTGVWEDIVGRLRNIEEYNQFRKNIVFFAPNSGTARAKFTDANAKIDAWITWEDWSITNDIGTTVEIEDDLAIYRPLVITHINNASQATQQFITFLQSKQAEAIFLKFGWFRKNK